MSSTKKVLFPYPMFNNVSIATNQTSEETNVAFLDFGIIDIEWTGSSPVGNINVEICKVQSDKNLLNKIDEWETLNFSNAVGGENIPISGASGSHRIILTKLPSTKIRLKYIATSGTGTMTAYISGKEC